ncbi:MAG: hypothetical protein O7C75_13760 [Verrucomicrobia bacterium]|nr:hypothetical protein [Verrucomicrobiota bacterium]
MHLKHSKNTKKYRFSAARGFFRKLQVNFDFTGNDAALYTTKILGDPDFDSLEILELQVFESGEVGISLATEQGKQYRVQYSDDMLVWKDAASVITGTGFEEIWTDNGPPETVSLWSETGGRFYRVVELDQ